MCEAPRAEGEADWRKEGRPFLTERCFELRWRDKKGRGAVVS